MCGPKDRDDDYDDKLDSYIEERIRNLEDIKEALPEDDPYQEDLDRQIENYEAVLEDDD